MEGPADYKPNTATTSPTNYYSGKTDGNIKWYYTGKGVTSYEFKNLIWGHYTIHIQDSLGCWMYKESGEIENVDTLKINVVKLMENAKCNGGLGKIAISAKGGVKPFSYAVDFTLVPHPESPSFPNDLVPATYLAGLKW